MVQEHSLVDLEEGEQTVYKCENCGLIYKNKGTFGMFRCSDSRIGLDESEE